ncbi:MAG: DUF948 domain-containing protein [Nitrospirae bacterium]|nr:DUF948 domain-containing protein [Nitrospirota bacterium]
MVNQILFVLITIAFLIMVAFLIPTIIQLRRTAKTIDEFLKTTQQSLKPLLDNLDGTVQTTNKIAHGIEDSIRNIRDFAQAVGNIGRLLNDINRLLKGTGASFAIKTASLGVAIKTALGVLVKGILKGGK